jgi:hypothetical protein
MDPAGLLAIQQPTVGSTSMAGSLENRIGLASLPPGDWMLMVGLQFGTTGDGGGVMSVHVAG